MSRLSNEKIKWYRPLKLLNRNKELEALTDELLIIIDEYADEIREKRRQISILEQIIESQKEDKEALLREIRL